MERKRRSEIRLKQNPSSQLVGGRVLVRAAGTVDLDDHGVDGGRCPVAGDSDHHGGQRGAGHADAEAEKAERQLAVVVEHTRAAGAAVVAPQRARTVEDDAHQQRTRHRACQQRTTALESPGCSAID